MTITHCTSSVCLSVPRERKVIHETLKLKWEVPYVKSNWQSNFEGLAHVVSHLRFVAPGTDGVSVCPSHASIDSKLITVGLCGFYPPVKKLKEVDIYSAFIVVPHTQGAQVRITQCYLQITPYLPVPRKHSPHGAFPDWGCGHLIAPYYSFIYPERMKGWVGLVGWPTADGLPT